MLPSQRQEHTITTTTKTKSTSTTPTVAEQAAESRRVLAAAMTRQAEAEQALEDAMGAVAEIRQSGRAGTRTATALDLMTLRAQVSLCDDDVKFAEAEVSRAKRALVNDQTDLAEAIRPVLAARYAGVEIVVTTLPTEAPEDAGTRPRLTITQDKANAWNAAGVLSGTVHVTLHRPPYVKGLDLDDLVEDLRKAGIYLGRESDSNGGDKTDGVCEDSLTLYVRYAVPTVPVIAQVTSPKIGHTIFQRIESALFHANPLQAGYSSNTGGGDSTAKITSVTASPGDEPASIIKTRVVDGIRYVTIRDSLRIGVRDARLNLADGAAMVATAIRALEGETFAGLGTVDGTPVVQHQPSGDTTLTMTFKSRVSE